MCNHRCDVDANGEQHEILRLRVDEILKLSRSDYATRMRSQRIQQRHQKSTQAFAGSLYWNDETHGKADNCTKIGDTSDEQKVHQRRKQRFNVPAKSCISN